MTDNERCRWCGTRFERSAGRGRPAVYCKRSHRQRHFEARKLAAAHKLAADDVLIGRDEYERIRDALYVLETTLLDARNDVVDGSTSYPDAFAELARAASELTGQGIQPKAVG